LRRHLTPWRTAGGIAVLLLATILILLNISSDKYILLVDPAHPVAPFVHVPGSPPKAGGGLIYYVDVFERRANELEALFPWIHSNASLEPAGAIVPPCATAAEAEAAQFQEMAVSQRVAAAVALRRLGYRVAVHPTGVVVSQLFANTNAPCNLQPMDVIVAVDGTPTPTIADLHRVLAGVTPGDFVDLRIRRGDRFLKVRLRTVAQSEEPGHAFIGISADQSATIKLPVHVSINLPSVGGPSAGLAFALEVMQRLGRNVTHGYRVAATGEMQLNGAVAPIGGVKQKTYGVREAGADVFLVPAGENAQTARRYAGPVHVIPVHSFGQALHALAALPRKQ
jgi:Lon-like protease